MCDVCVAEGALRKEGIKITWDGAPKKAKPVLIFARGMAEGPASYRIFLEGRERGPSQYTDDLALVCMRFGLDVRWPLVPKVVQRWVMGGPRPTMTSIVKSGLRRRPHAAQSWEKRVAERISLHLEAHSMGDHPTRRISPRKVWSIMRDAEKLYGKWAARRQRRARLDAKRPKKALGGRLMNNLRVYDRTPARA